MVAPTSQDRAKAIAEKAQGFLYCVSSLGVTGVRSSFSSNISEIIALAKSAGDVPCAIGFGISTPDDIPPLPKPVEKQPEPESITMFDESILSNYVADEPKEKPERKRNDRQNDRAQEQRPRKNYNRPRQDRKPRNQDNKPRPQKSAAPQEGAKAVQKDGAAKPKNNGGRRRYYRGNKKPSGGNQNQGS